MEKIKKEETKAIELASKLGENADNNQISNMEVKLPSMKRGPIAKIWDKVCDIYNGFMSEETPSSLKVLLLGSLLYLVLPIDIVPDFIPVGGLIDDVTVLTFVWSKLVKVAKLGNHIGSSVVKQTVGDKIQESIKTAYNKAFEFGKDKLDSILKKKAKNTIKNCVLSLIAFVIAILFLLNDTQESALISSIIIIILLLRTIFSFIRNIPLVFQIIKIYIKEKNIDDTIAVYLKTTYAFIQPIEDFKNKIKVFKDIPDLKELVYLQRKALMKTIIEITITVVLAIILAFVFKRVLIYYTDYNFIEIITLPFLKLFKLFK